MAKEEKAEQEIAEKQKANTSFSLLLLIYLPKGRGDFVCFTQANRKRSAM